MNDLNRPQDLGKVPQYRIRRQLVLQIIAKAYPEGLPHQLHTEEYYAQVGTQFCAGEVITVHYPGLAFPTRFYVVINDRNSFNLLWGTQEPEMEAYRAEVEQQLNASSETLGQ